MKTLKKISLKGISKILSEKELKNVLGGGGGDTTCYQCSNGIRGYYASDYTDFALDALGKSCSGGWMSWPVYENGCRF